MQLSRVVLRTKMQFAIPEIEYRIFLYSYCHQKVSHYASLEDEYLSVGFRFDHILGNAHIVHVITRPRL